MTTYFLEPRGQLLDAAKAAALDAVSGYDRLNPYTIGVAVQAAAAVLRTDVHPVTARLAPDTWDLPSIEVSPRLRALESVVAAARSAHPGDDHAAAGCTLCEAFRHLDQAD